MQKLFARWSEDAEYLRDLDPDYAVPRRRITSAQRLKRMYVAIMAWSLEFKRADIR